MQKKPESQSTDEWLADYGGVSHTGAASVAIPIPLGEPLLILRFDHHRTTRDGRLVTAFRSQDEADRREFVAFNNVDVRRQRGPSAGKQYCTGVGGRFLPAPRSKFRSWWLDTIQAPPRRWSEVHHEMHKLRQLEFIATSGFDTETDKSGEKYYKLKELPIRSTDKRHTVDEASTSGRQITSTRPSFKPSSDAAFGRISVPSVVNALKPSSPVTRNAQDSVEYIERQIQPQKLDTRKCPHCDSEGCHWCAHKGSIVVGVHTSTHKILDRVH